MSFQQAATPQTAPGARPDAPVITVEGLYKSFGTKKVLQDFSLTVQPGENVVVLGKSGSGKSVLIKCIIGLLTPDTGRITLLGKEVGALNNEAMDQLRARVGFLFQSNALYDSMTVRENLLFPLRRHWLSHSGDQEEELVKRVLDDVGLGHTADQMPAELSGGMRKRIALARTLILQPEVLLYDEPTTGLDPVTSREISSLIREVQRKYKAGSVIISHDMSCVRMTADRIAVLHEGHCYAIGTYDQLSASTDPVIRDFFI